MPFPKISGPKKKSTAKGGSFLSSSNGPLIIGGVLGGAVLLLLLSNRNSSNTGSPLTLYPSTDADQSTLSNLIAAVQAMTHNQSVGGSNPNPVPTPNPNTPGAANGVTTTSSDSLVTSSNGHFSSYTQAAGVQPGFTATPAQSNAIWTAISHDVNALSPGALVQPLNIQGNAVVPMSASPEQTATKEQYQAMVLGQYAGQTGQYAPGAPVDVSKGMTAQGRQFEVQYYQNILATGAYNPNLPAISSKQAVSSLLYSMTQDPKYL